MVAADRDNMVIEHHKLMMNMLRIPDQQSQLQLRIQTLRLICTGATAADVLSFSTSLRRA